MYRYGYGRNMRARLGPMLGRAPSAAADIEGSARYPGIYGRVLFYRQDKGVLVSAEIHGLPTGAGGACESPVFAFHIHEGSSCTGNASDPFADAGMHYNPGGCPHPYHAGDMPPLFSAGGDAYLAFITDRFAVDEVMGRSVVIHAMPDDFKTQPSGGSGMKIACGQIYAC